MFICYVYRNLSTIEGSNWKWFMFYYRYVTQNEDKKQKNGLTIFILT